MKADTLAWHDGKEERSLAVGSSAWYEWLATASTFSFSSSDGSFVARKERFRRGGWFWNACATLDGKLRVAYLGKAEALTVERLNQVAAELFGSSRGDTSGRTDTLEGVAAHDQHEPAAGRAASASMKPADRSARVTPQDSLLMMKLSPPPLRSDLMMRPQLSQRLAEVLERKLTLISAPAGFGKTTLLSQWKEQCGYPIAWLSLDASDNDPARFWAYVFAAIQTLYPGAGSQALALLRSSQRSPEEAFLTALINSLTAWRDDFVLVLDDYHLVESQAVHTAMTFLLDHLPPRMHVVIASRADPPIPVARLRAKRQLGELRAADLSFTFDETATFFREVMGLGLSAEEVATLEKSTEGWIAGLQLAALSLQECEDIAGFIKRFAGNHRYILDYLVEEVLRQQPYSVRNFLLQTSILDRFSGSLCEAVTGQGNGQAMLERLERANLFIVPLDNERRWYRYHRLFADSLRASLHEAQVENESELHRRAALWFAKNGLATEGVSHVLAAEEFEMAADLIEESAQLMLGRNEYVTIMAWIRALPRDLMWRRPQLCIRYGWALASTNQLDAAEAWLDEVERHLGVSTKVVGSARTADPTDGPHAGQSVLGDLFALRTTIASLREDLPLTISLSHQALAHLPKDAFAPRSSVLRVLGAAYRQSGDVVRASQMLAETSLLSQANKDFLNAATSLSQLASTYAIQGQLHQSAKANWQALELAAEQGSELFPIASRPYLGLALLQYEWNDLSAATCSARYGIDLASRGGLMDILLGGYGVLARLKQAEGDIEGALDTVERGEQLARANNFPQHVVRLSAYKIRLWLKKGKVEAAIGWAETSGLQIEGELSYQHEAEYMSLARVRMVQGMVDKAVELLGRLLKGAEQAERTGSTLKILALRAAALHARGDRNGGLMDLRRALALGQPEGYVRSFVDMGVGMAGMLATVLEGMKKGYCVLSSDGLEDYVRMLLAAFGTQGKLRSVETGTSAFGEGELMASTDSSPEAARMAVDQLSEREREVLRLIATGASNQEIALELVVAESTIKKHINNIYSKLDVRSRMQAIVRARALGLLIS